MIKMPSGNRNIFFSHFSCTPVRTCVYGRYAPEVLKITANYLWQSVPDTSAQPRKLGSELV